MNKKILSALVILLLSSFVSSFAAITVTPFSSGGTVCSGDADGTLITDSIVIHGAPFNTGGGAALVRTIELTAPAGFSFNTIYGAVIDTVGLGFTNQIVNLTASTMTISYQLSSSAVGDSIIVKDFKVIASHSATSGNITRTGGNTMTIEIPNGTVFGALEVSHQASIVSQTNLDCFGDSDGTALVALTPASGASAATGVTYNWSSGSPSTTSINVAGLSGGSHTVTVSFNGTCSDTAVVNILEPSILNAAATQSSPVSFFGGADGAATAAASTGGTGAYSFVWDSNPTGTPPTTGAATETPSGMIAGDYIVTVTDANSCSDDATVTITEPTPLVAGIISVSKNDWCEGGNSIPFTASAPTGGGVAPTYTWQFSENLSSWNDISTGTNIGVNAQVLTYNTTLTKNIFIRRKDVSGPETVYTNTVALFYHTKPLVGLSGVDSDYCESEGSTYTFIGYPTSANGSFSMFTGLVDNLDGTSTFTPGVTATGSKTVTYTYTDNYGCSNTVSKNLNVNVQPIATSSGLPSTMTTTEGQVTLTGAPAGGFFTGVGLSNNDFYPEIAGVGTHVIEYNYYDASTKCTAQISQQTVTVSTGVGGAVNVLGLESFYCIYDGIVNLSTASVVSKVTGAGISGSLGSYKFNPASAGAGTKYLSWYRKVNVYTTIDLGILGKIKVLTGTTDQLSGIIRVTVIPTPVVELSNLKSDYCSNDEIQLIRGIPSNGNFTGDLTGNTIGVFNPASKAANNLYNFTYTYVDDYGCTNSINGSTYLHNKPTAVISGLPTNPINGFCTNASPTVLTGNFTTNSSFVGIGINTLNGSGTATFDPSVFSSNTSVLLEYRVIDGNSCMDTVSHVLNVNLPPTVSIITATAADYCVDNLTLNTIEGTPLGGYYSGALSSGYVDNSGGFATLTPSLLPQDDTTLIIYNYQDPSTKCLNKSTRKIRINSLPTPKILIDTSYCENSGEVTISGIPYSNTANWTGGPGGIITDSVFNVNSMALDSKNYFTYEYTDSYNCTNSVTDSTYFQSKPVVTIVAPSQYCEDAEVDTLTITPSGGLLEGIGFINLASRYFDPSIPVEGPDTLTYTYKDPITGCSDTVSHIIQIDYLPLVSFSGFTKKEYCEDEPIVLLTGNQTPNGSFSGPGITDLSNGTGTFDILSLNPSIDTIVYTYTNGKGCTNSQTQIIKINQLPSVNLTLSTGADTAFCDTDGVVTLIGSPTGTLGVGGNAKLYGAGIFNNFFEPKTSIVGIHDIVYEYRDVNSCVNYDTVTVVVHPSPVANFRMLNFCNDVDLGFEDLTTVMPTVTNPVSSIVKWSWVFDQNKKDTSDLQNPFNDFSVFGEIDNELTVTTNYGCSNYITRTDTIGEPPVPEFTWDNVCNGSTTVFNDTLTKDNDDIILWEWQFDTGLPIVSKTQREFVPHDYPVDVNGLNAFEVKLKHTTKYGCEDSLSKTIYKREVVDVFPYYEDFSTNYNWFPQNHVGDTVNSWQYGSPSAQIINHSNNGDVFATNLSGPYKGGEKSWIDGPCFDFSTLQKPIIKLMIWWEFPQSDGVVLQSSIDGGNTWQNVGDLSKNAVNWYDKGGINSGPGDQTIASGSVGWALSSGGWVESRHKLDHLAGEPSVKLRFGFSSLPSISQVYEGFALDYIWIGERHKSILLEHFTSMSNTISHTEDVKINNLVDANPLDVINIQYHLGSDGYDPLFMDNEADPSARALAYSVNNIPWSVMDGNYLNATSSEFDQDLVDRRLLEDSRFTIKLATKKIGSTYDVAATFIPLDTFYNADLIARIAIVEKVIDVSGFGISGTPQIQKYTLKSFYPDAGGYNYVQDFLPYKDSITIQFSYTVDNAYDEDTLGVVAFIQENSSPNIEVHHVTADWLSPTAPNVAVAISSYELSPLEMYMYPNPTQGEAYLSFDKAFTSSKAKVEVYDQLGNIVYTKKLNASDDAITIQTEDWTEGLYIVRVMDERGTLFQEKLSYIK